MLFMFGQNVYIVLILNLKMEMQLFEEQIIKKIAKYYVGQVSALCTLCRFIASIW